MYDPMVVDKFIEVQEALSADAQEPDSEKAAIDSIATKLRITPEVSASTTMVEVSERLPIKVLSLLRSIHPSPSGLSIDDLGVIVTRQLVRLTNSSSIALYGVVENGHSIRCLFADGCLSQLVGGPDICLGERLSGWVAAHRTPIWNSDATLDLPNDLAVTAGISLGSSVPLIDSGILVGVLTFYAPPDCEIAVEQRVLIQSIAPHLATALSTSTAHDRVASIDGTDRQARETLYEVLDALLSHRTVGINRDHPESMAIVLVAFTPSPESDRMREALLRGIQAGGTLPRHSHCSVVRLSSNELLITAQLSVLAGLGIDPASAQRFCATNGRHTSLSEIANSLQLREVLRLTQPSEQVTVGKQLVH